MIHTKYHPKHKRQNDESVILTRKNLNHYILVLSFITKRIRDAERKDIPKARLKPMLNPMFWRDS